MTSRGTGVAHQVAQQVIDDCRTLARFSEDASCTTRTFLSPPTHEVHHFLGLKMKALGMEVSVDAIGNLRGIYRGRESHRRLLLGSHMDTVPNAGAFDGLLGVVLAIALVRGLEDRAPKDRIAGDGSVEDGRPNFDIEVVAFSEEEGVRFGVPFLGSRALVGDFDSALLQRTDAAGITMEQAVRDFGLEPSQIPAAQVAGEAFAYIEFHIEQGPVLESLGTGLGVVEAIVGQTRLDVIFRGKANHAGTTPMPLRRDALAGAVEWMVAVEQLALSTPGLVATVGQIAVQPGAANVVPGAARLGLDVRHASDVARTGAVEALMQQATSIALRRGLTAEVSVRTQQPAVAMAAGLAAQLEVAAKAVGHATHRMVSGAGHDAMVMAAKVPAAMLFLRSPGGISHHPDESVLVEDVEAALATGLYFLEHLQAEEK